MKGQQRVRAAILTAATGHGHVAAARALGEAVRARGGSAELLDIAASHPLVAGLVELYNLFLRRPPAWMLTFFRAVNGWRLDRLGYALAHRWGLRELRRIRPTIILSVHPMANHGLGQLTARGDLEQPFAVALTDLAPPFWRGWADPRAAVITAPTPEAAAQLSAWGVAPERVRAAPIPIRPAFRGPVTPACRRAARQTFGLQEDRLTLILSGGTASRVSVLKAYRALAAAMDLAGRIQVIVVAGREPRVLRRALRLRPPFPAAVLSWCEDPETLLAAADLLFTKPGALTVSEALAAGVPVLLDECGGVVPHEQGNARWVRSAEAGWVVEVPEAVPALLRALTPEDRTRTGARARAAVAGDATTVLDVIAEALEGGPRPAPGPAQAPSEAHRPERVEVSV